jgi:hypothetical protein
MQELINELVESQAPWMVLSVVLIMFIIKLQNDKMLELGKSMARLVLLYEAHDKQASEIHQETTYIKEWCISKMGDSMCKP